MLIFVKAVQFRYFLDTSPLSHIALVNNKWRAMGIKTYYIVEDISFTDARSQTIDVDKIYVLILANTFGQMAVQITKNLCHIGLPASRPKINADIHLRHDEIRNEGQQAIFLVIIQS